MKYKKVAVAVLGIISAIVLGLAFNGWFNAGQALPPAKETVKVDAREIVLGDEGDSIAGNRKGARQNQKKSKSGVAGISGESPAGKVISLAYTCIGDKVFFDNVFPAFQKYWLEKTGEQVEFATGYALPDFDTVATSVSGQPVQVLVMTSASNPMTRGYNITKWQQTTNNGVAYSYPQVFLVRKGNPKRIKTYADLTIPGIRVIHVNPLRGTGAGLWQVYGIYGSALRETELATGNKDRKAALERLQQVEENTFCGASLMPEAMNYFLQGTGDVIVAPEFSALMALKKSDDVEMVLPPYTVISDLTVFKMDKNISADEQTVVDEFIDFLFSEEVQEYLADFGFRPADPVVLARHTEFKELVYPFHLDYLGEATQLKKDIILGKWLSINNARNNKNSGSESNDNGNNGKESN